MIHLKFSPKEAIAESVNNLLKAFMIANGSDEQIASLFGATVSGAIKGINIDKKQSIYNELDTAIKESWVEILSKGEFECLEETCKIDLQCNVITSQNVFEALVADNPEGVLRTKISAILGKYTNWKGNTRNEYARFIAEQLLIEVNDRIRYDGILTLIQEIEKLRNEIISRQDTLEQYLLTLFERVIRKLDTINGSVDLIKENSIAQPSIPELFWNAGKDWYEDSRKPGARFHSLNIVRDILPTATEKPLNQAEPEFGFPFRAYDTDGHIIRCSRFSDLILDKNSIYHQEHIMLVGEGGIGKTTTLMSAMYDAYNKKECYNGESVIPLFIELSLSPDSQDSHAFDGVSSSVIHRMIYAMLVLKQNKKDRFDFLRECMNDESSIAKETVRELLYSVENEKIKYALLIDGLNEVSAEPFTGNRSSSAQGRILQEITEMIDRYHNLTIILTGRYGVFIDHPSFHSFYLHGLEWDEIEKYLRKKEKSDEEISLIRNGDRDLKTLLSIPMFLTMYVLLHDSQGITTRGELLKIFFHERFERRKKDYYIQRQGDIAARIVLDGEQSITGATMRGKITLSMQWMFLDILIPEIALKMEKTQIFRLSEKEIRSLLDFLFNNKDSLYCGVYNEYSNDCFVNRFQSELLTDVIFDFTKAYENRTSKYTAAFLNYCELSMGILYKAGDNTYGFIHQHLRDYFAAVCIINKLKIAYIAFQESNPITAREILRQYGKAPLDPILMDYIGEYLEENHNNPVNRQKMDNTSEATIPREALADRFLISGIMNLYRGVDQENDFIIYNFIEVLKRVRKDLSGLDLHSLDLRHCHFNGVVMDTIPGIDFSNAIINGNNWFPEGHSDSLRDVHFSPNNQLIVTASWDQSACVWNIHSRQLVHRLKGHTGWVNTADFSADGQYIVTASIDDTACIWDVNSGDLLHVLKGHTARVNTASFSRDVCYVITASNDGKAYIWDVLSGEILHSLEGHSAAVKTAVFSKDSHFVVTASEDKTARIWNAHTGELIHVLKGHSEAVNSAAFSNNIKYIITASEDKTARIWDTFTGKLVKVLRGHSEAVTIASFSPNDKYAITGSYDYSACVWSVDAGRLLHTFKHYWNVTVASFSPNGELIITASVDNTACIWDSASGKLLYKFSDVDGGPIYSACFSPDSNYVAIAFSSTLIHILKASSGALFHSFRGAVIGVSKVSFSNSGDYFVTVSKDHTARIWNPYSGLVVHSLEGHFRDVVDVAISSDDNYIITGSYDSDAIIWEAYSGKLLHKLIGHSRGIRSVAVSPDGNSIVTASTDRTVKIWSLKTGKMLCSLNEYSAEVNNAYYNPNGNLIVTAAFDGSTKIWNAYSGTLYFSLPNQSRGVCSALYSPDGKFILTTCLSDTARVWDANSGELLHELTGHTETINYASFSPNSKIIITISYDRTARIWDVYSGELLHLIRRYARYARGINIASFSPDSNQVIIASSYNGFSVWNVHSGDMLYSTKVEEGVLFSSYNPDGNLIVTTSSDNVTRIWRADKGILLNTLYEVPGLHIKNVDFRGISQQSRVTTLQKTVFRQYGAEI